MRNKYDTTEPRFLFDVRRNSRTWSYINNNRIMKILEKAGHPVEFISPAEYPAYLKKKREVLKDTESNTIKEEI